MGYLGSCPGQHQGEVTPKNKKIKYILYIGCALNKFATSFPCCLLEKTPDNCLHFIWLGGSRRRGLPRAPFLLEPPLLGRLPETNSFANHAIPPCLCSFRPTFRCVPVHKGVDQRPAFAVVSSGQLQPVGLQSTDNLALSGDPHRKRPLVVLAAQRVQRNAAWGPGMEEDQQTQVFRSRQEMWVYEQE